MIFPQGGIDEVVVLQIADDMAARVRDNLCSLIPEIHSQAHKEILKYFTESGIAFESFYFASSLGEGARVTHFSLPIRNWDASGFYGVLGKALTGPRVRTELVVTGQSDYAAVKRSLDDIGFKDKEEDILVTSAPAKPRLYGSRFAKS